MNDEKIKLRDLHDSYTLGSVGMMIESVYYHKNFMVYSRDQMNEN